MVVAVVAVGAEPGLSKVIPLMMLPIGALTNATELPLAAAHKMVNSCPSVRPVVKKLILKLVTAPEGLSIKRLTPLLTVTEPFVVGTTD